MAAEHFETLLKVKGRARQVLQVDGGYLMSHAIYNLVEFANKLMRQLHVWTV